MATKRPLLSYLPPYLQEYKEVQYALNPLDPEFEAFQIARDNALDDQFIMYATENGVKRYEKILKLVPKDTDTLEERRFRILAAMNRDLPYTIPKLEEMLTVLCGVGNYFVNLQPANYHIEIKLALINKNNYQEVVDLLAKIIPANLTSHVQIMYNTHIVLGEFTHATLANYTQTDLRNEVINNG